MSLNSGSILIYDINDVDLDQVLQIGTYSIHFNIIDNAQNVIDVEKNIEIHII